MIYPALFLSFSFIFTVIFPGFRIVSCLGFFVPYFFVSNEAFSFIINPWGEGFGGGQFRGDIVFQKS